MNFVYINTHDTGRMIQPYGYSVNTEALQQLAEEGTLFTHAYCCSPTCSPSRAAMLTGTTPHENGMLGLAQRGFSLVEPKQHLANYLASKGYQTALSGIQHEVSWYLDIEEDLLHQLGYQEVLTVPSKKYQKEELHLWDKENVKAAVDWLKQVDQSKPFMLSYGLHSTHRPYPVEIAENIDERYVKPTFPFDSVVENRHDQAQFMTTAQYADQNIAYLIESLKELGLYENTVILFTTDHGLALPFHKCTLKDDGIGVSLILRHPKLGQGRVVDQLVSHIDVFSTVCDCLGLEIPAYVEGISFLKTLEEDVATREEIYAEVNFHTSYEPMRCVRTKRYKYIQYFDSSWQYYNLSNMDEALPKDFLLENGLQEKKKPMEALYDCYYDSNEMNNLIDDPTMGVIKQELKDKLHQHMLETNDPLLKGELEIKPTYKVNKKSAVHASSKNQEDYDPRGRVN